MTATRQVGAGGRAAGPPPAERESLDDSAARRRSDIDFAAARLALWVRGECESLRRAIGQRLRWALRLAERSRRQ